VDATQWWQPPLLYFLLSWKMMRKSCTPHQLKSSKMTSFIFFFQTASLVSTGTNWFGQKNNLHPQLLEYVTTVKLYLNLEFDKTSRCPMDVYARFYYDVFYIPLCVMVGLYIAFGVWWIFLKANSHFNLLGRFWELVHMMTCGKIGEKQTKRHWRKRLEFHRHQAARARWLVYIYIYAPLTRKCSTMFFCRDDIRNEKRFLKTDMSVECDDVRYQVAFSVAVAMFVLVGFAIPLYIAWTLYYSPNSWKIHDDESRLFNVGEYVGVRKRRVYYENVTLRAVVEVAIDMTDIRRGSPKREAIERDVRSYVATALGIESHLFVIHNVVPCEPQEANTSSVSAYLKEGVLLKRKGLTDTWQDRELFLSHRSLKFLKPRRSWGGSLNKDEIVSVEAIEPAAGIPGWSFEVKTKVKGGKVYAFACKHKQDRDEWVHAIATCITEEFRGSGSRLLDRIGIMTSQTSLSTLSVPDSQNTPAPQTVEPHEKHCQVFMKMVSGHNTEVLDVLQNRVDNVKPEE
jgi:hypothetical protein